MTSIYTNLEVICTLYKTHQIAGKFCSTLVATYILRINHNYSIAEQLSWSELYAQNDWSINIILTHRGGSNLIRMEYEMEEDSSSTK